MSESPKDPGFQSLKAIVKNVAIATGWLAAIIVPFVIFFEFVLGGREPINVPIDEVVILSSADADKDWHPVPPAEKFEHPAAQKLLELGKALVADPGQRDRAARDLNIMARRPELLSHDQVAFLAVRTAYSQLRNHPEPYASIEVARLIWDAAKGLEARQSALADTKSGTKSGTGQPDANSESN